MQFPVNPARTFDARIAQRGGLTDAVGAARAGSARKPVLLAVDDEAEARRGLSRELHKRYGDDYRVVCEGSAEAGVRRLRELKEGGEEVALVLADQ